MRKHCRRKGIINSCRRRPRRIPPIKMRTLCLAAALLHGADAFGSVGGIPQVIFVHDAVLDDFLGEALVMEAHNKGEINLLGAAAGKPPFHARLREVAVLGDR